jgi:hypothetical protein
MKSFFRSVLILAGAVAAPAFLSAQPVPPAPPVAVAASTNTPAPRIEFNTEHYDSGKTLAGKPVNYTFQVTNAGDTLLEISNAHGSCSCTTTSSVWPQQVAPHHTLDIPIVIQTQPSARGAQEKTVTVTSNDPKRPLVTLHVVVNSWIPIDVTPPQVAFNIKPGASGTPNQVLHITNREDQPLVLFPPVSDIGSFSAVLKTNVPGQEFELTVSAASPSQAPLTQGTSLSGNITLKTSSTNMPELKISASAFINPEITVAPSQMNLQRGPLSQPYPIWIGISDNTGRGLTLSDPAINVPGLDVSLKVMVTNSRYSLVVNFPPGFEMKPGSNVVATVKTDNPRCPIISVPAFASLAPPLTMPPRLQQTMPAHPPGLKVLTNGQVRSILPQPVPVTAAPAPAPNVVQTAPATTVPNP